MSLYLYGVISHPEPIDFGMIGFGGARVRSIPLGTMAAVSGPSPQIEFTKIPKQELITLLLAHQQTLETIMKRFFVLPFKFGTVVKDEAELTWVLEEGRPLLLKMVERVQGCAEVDVVGTWDVKAILQEISGKDSEIAACKSEMAHGLGDRAFVGMLLAQALKRRADAWRNEITKALEAHAAGHADHDLLNDEMVLNTSFLVCRNGEKEFFRAIEEVDRSFQGKLNFKCVGPLPPYSFSTVSVKRFNPKEVQEAAKALGLNGRAELADVKKRYKELSRTVHPDTNPGISLESFEHLNKAYELLADYCGEGARSLEKEAAEGYIKLTAGGGTSL